LHASVCTCLFLDSGLGRTTIYIVVSAGDPLFIVVLLALTLTTYWPWLSLALPRALNLL
jgi:TRAP-type C4-dicarboxylate transport system permease large subunit